jgi:hypothetical protein
VDRLAAALKCVFRFQVFQSFRPFNPPSFILPASLGRKEVGGANRNRL